MTLRNRTLILFKYFWETTDEAHPVSLADISAHLKEHGITADARTLRNDIEQLVEFGVDIVKDRRVQNLYHVEKQGAGQTADARCRSRQPEWAAGGLMRYRQICAVMLFSPSARSKPCDSYRAIAASLSMSTRSAMPFGRFS